MQNAGNQDREKVIEERLEAIDWALGNIDRIEDRLVRAYTVKLKQMVEEEERRLEKEMGAG